MGTISEKLTYLNTTKQNIKQAINNLGGDIDNNTTFRNYATELNDIYDNLPKVSDTGTNVSLSPTLKGRLGIVPKGNTLQDGTPTPDTPVEIQSATGTQKVVVSGKNLFDKDNANILNASISSTVGSIASSPQTYQTVYIPCKANTTYTISKLYDTTKNRFVVGYTNEIPVSGTTIYGGITDNTKDKTTITTGSDALYLIAYVWITGSTSTYQEMLDSIQIEANSTATPYQPYITPQEVDIELSNIELNKIGDYEDYIGGTPDNWVLHKNVGKVVLDGSISFDKQDAWSNVGNNTNAFYKGYTAFDNMKPNSVVMSDNFVYLSNIVTNDSYGIYLTTNLIIRVPKTITNKSELNNWLSTHNVEILYPLATGTTETITDTTLISQLNELYYLMSYDDTTNIDVTGNLPMRITASAIKGA